MRSWRDDIERSAHPLRDSAIIYGVLAGVIVLVTALTGGNVARGVVAALAFFALAMGWAWWRLRQSLQERGRR